MSDVRMLQRREDSLKVIVDGRFESRLREIYHFPVIFGDVIAGLDQ